MLPQLDKPSSYGFDDGSDASDWSGVSVNTQDRITAVNVANRGLSGELPAALGDVSCLEQLHATSNLFDGEPLATCACNTYEYTKHVAIEDRSVNHLSNIHTQMHYYSSRTSTSTIF